MNILSKFLSLSLCLVILISFNAHSAIGDDLGEDSNIEKNLTIDIPLNSLIEPLTLLNAPILSDEIQYNFSETSSSSESIKYSFLTNDLPPPAK